MDDLPRIEGTPIPLLAAKPCAAPREVRPIIQDGYAVRRVFIGLENINPDNLIKVRGRKSRHRSPADIEKIVCLSYAEGMRSFFITDDNFARNKNWEPILDRLIHLREAEKLDIGFIIQVHT